MNKFVDFIDDQCFLDCIKSIYIEYEKQKNEYTIKKFYNNQIDPIKLTFDMIFSGVSEKELIEREVQRQMDKNISNFIGHFHEKLLGEIEGFIQKGNAGYDIKRKDNTLFAEIKNKRNTVNSSSKESTYQKLERFAEEYSDAKCYWVSLIAPTSYCTQWNQTFDKTKGPDKMRVYNHPRVYKVSGDYFYEIVTGDSHAFAKVCKALPRAIEDLLQTQIKYTTEIIDTEDHSHLFSELFNRSQKNGTNILTQLFNDNFGHYKGFPI
ncbi:hypothetical protein AJ85_16860 [Alkalihalobacillus alcalophilus ATCC 27647 = CGMCC 1.3604]|uniref:Uncharacterized protein n=1 Tax=Alkalihalobacillus alcalophilus ATCC 27647 = CGMCC 1.3604 TaxID=1218173 RepID=A0A094WIW2_ALKAL|nr:Eco47II family restriction endonuclease [Alkalihalobacillus alcalophilus]KGA96741.1 hypothetical protein BALCAV_0214365 [Alkalihalobacillus alcalophilus ATCC 27647 = CGMCC 1.3604]MED1563810.1 Eco47II family restriction endonuclease [Alkalihalobacillus alcalophilus]THG92114.1 hypothetical protein AJ85_16860 [Alkalihalobacillus alcalophilus ATCC 27647 = CGMCC 1.3604]